jgi:hypothetical protein
VSLFSAAGVVQLPLWQHHYISLIKAENHVYNGVLHDQQMKAAGLPSPK